MSKLREAAQQVVNEHEAGFVGLSLDKAVAALRAALAEPTCKDHLHVEPVQEPVAWGMRHSDGRIYDCIAPGEHDREPGQYTVPIYTHPAPQRQPLTDEEIDRVTDVQWAANHNRPVYAAHRAFARAIEQRHGIGGQDDTR